MRTTEMIAELQALVDEHGDCELLVTDGYQAECYRGDFATELFVDCNGYKFIDIGIGGCRE